MIKTIIFDYDGTIHQTLGIYEPAFRETYQWLTEQKVSEEQKIASSKIAGWLGLNSKEMWDTFMPELDQKYKDQASKMVGERMIEQVRKHKAVWYPGAEKMLTTLKNQGYYLVVLSNCKTAYRKAHWEEFGMKRWFERFYDCESYGFRPKTEIVQDIIREYPGPYLVIGDRKQDLNVPDPVAVCLPDVCMDMVIRRIGRSRLSCRACRGYTRIMPFGVSVIG